tara:strand:- start:707 stop:1882 length:1176 start_codon:yes stop_codon:yes gene_type:complete
MEFNLRDQIPALKNKHYFNYGGQGPLPKSSLEAIIQTWEKIQDLGPFTNDMWPFIYKEILTTKNIIAKQLGVNSKNIALTENISSGIVLPFWGIKVKAGEELLISDCEHPGVVAASREFCRRNKLKFRILPIQKIKNINDEKIISEISKNLNSKTKILIISHVLWNFGYQIPLKKIAIELKDNRENTYLIIDGAQTFGHITIEEEVIYSDLYSITSHKWACGPEGLGAIYVSDRFIQETDPTIIGWKSLKKEQGIYEPAENLFHEDARKFEVATSCIPLMAGLRNSLDLLEKDVHKKDKSKIIKKLSQKLWDELDQINEIDLVLEKKYLNGIISFNIENIQDKNKFVQQLGEKKIWIRVLEDPKWFRACVHQFTTEAEINLLSQEIKKILE